MYYNHKIKVNQNGQQKPESWHIRGFIGLRYKNLVLDFDFFVGIQ